MDVAKHRNNFDALRLAAALAVMVSHVSALTGAEEPRPYAGITLGTYAVNVFFVISGYLVSRSWQREPAVVPFWLKRMLRIAPAYIVAISLTALCLGVAGIDDFEGNPLPYVNGSLWTIPYEVQCYAVLVALFLLTRHAGLLFAAVVLAFGVEHQLLGFGAFFAAGAILTRYAILQRSVALAAIWVVGYGLAERVSVDAGVVLMLSAATIWVGASAWPLIRSIGRHGDISYGVYLYAFPVQQALIAWRGPDAGTLSLLLAAVAVTVVLAYCSWRLVEAPALALKRCAPLREASRLGVGENAAGT